MGTPRGSIRPMLATLGDLPAGAGWAYEFKWDGVRAIVAVRADAVTLTSRNDRDLTPSYPELAERGAWPAMGPVVVDGEIVALDEHGRPSFSRLQQRMHVARPTPALLARVPVRLYLFDLLYEAGQSLMDLPYRERRARLVALGCDTAPVETPPAWPGGGPDALAAARELGLEGVVAKRVTAPYEPGVRSRAWIKTPLNTTIEVVIAGWRPGEGRRAGTIGSLLLGRYDAEGRLRYVGQVGTGFTDRMLTDLHARLPRLATNRAPFATPVPREQARDAHWVRPSLVGEVEYRTVTPDGRLRHPAWRGLRPDREPTEVGGRAPGDEPPDRLSSPRSRR